MDPRGIENAECGFAADALQPVGHRLLGIVYLWKRQHDLAIATVEQALALDQNEADTYYSLAEIMNFSGRPEETPRLIEKAMRLNPHYPARYLWCVGHAYFLLTRYDEAVAAFKRALARNPDFVPANGFLAIVYGELGLSKEAETAGATTLQLSPQFSRQWIQQRLPYKDSAVLELVQNALRRAGLG